jgi:hypothetical protein
MLDWFKSWLRRGDETTHPLQTDKGLQEVIDSLPWHCPAAALPELGNWLQSVEELPPAPAQALIRAVRKLDEAGRDGLETCGRELLGKPGEEVQEGPWLVLAAHYERLSAAYRLALSAAASDEKLAGDKNLLALLAVRAMHALMRRKLLLRLRYRYPDAGFWRSAHELLAEGRSQAVAHLRVVPYAGADATTLLAEYLWGLLLEVAPGENLTPPQIACADRLIGHQRHGILFRDAPGATAPYYVDVAGDQGPVRTAPSGQRPPSARYFGVGKLGPYVFSLMKEAASRDDLPESLADTGCSLEEYRSLLKLLCDHWLGDPPRRRHARRKTDAELLAVHGFPQVRRMVAASCFARSGRQLGYKTHLEMMARHSSRFGHVQENAPTPPDAELPLDKMTVLQQLETAGDRELMEQWTLLDISERGLGAALSHHRRWLRVGALIGFRAKDSIDWRVGILRRIGRGGQGRRVVGVEVLPGIPISVQYVPLEQQERSPWSLVPELMTPAWQDAILVSSISHTLLLERGKFVSGRVVKMVFEGQASHLRLLQLVEQGRDFDLVVYEDVAAPPA